jgi:hypothetical protein
MFVGKTRALPALLANVRLGRESLKVASHRLGIRKFYKRGGEILQLKNKFVFKYEKNGASSFGQYAISSSVSSTTKFT